MGPRFLLLSFFGCVSALVFFGACMCLCRFQACDVHRNCTSTLKNTNHEIHKTRTGTKNKTKKNKRLVEETGTGTEEPKNKHKKKTMAQGSQGSQGWVLKFGCCFWRLRFLGVFWPSQVWRSHFRWAAKAARSESASTASIQNWKLEPRGLPRWSQCCAEGAEVRKRILFHSELRFSIWPSKLDRSERG